MGLFSKDRDELEFEQTYNTYGDKEKLKGYIASLEEDNEVIRRGLARGGSKRRGKKLIKINDKDIQKYKKMLMQAENK